MKKHWLFLVLALLAAPAATWSWPVGAKLGAAKPGMNVPLWFASSIARVMTGPIGDGLTQLDPFWSRLHGALSGEGALATLQPLYESLAPAALQELKDGAADRRGLGMLETLAQARNDAAAQAWALHKDLAPAEGAGLEQWQLYEEALKPLALYSPEFEARHAAVKRIVADLKSENLKKGIQAVSAALGASAEDADETKPARGLSTGWVRSMIEKGKAVEAGDLRLGDVVQRLGFSATALNREVLTSHNTNYTVELSLGPVTDQKQSGRCWIFAGLNMVRSMMQPGEKAPKDLELSENYLHFFNMLEKANDHLETVVDKMYKRHPKAEKFAAAKRRMTVIPGIGDGGWYEWFAFLVSKYGMVPKAAMPETISSAATATLLRELDSSLASTSSQLLANAKLYKAGKAPNRSKELKERGMARVWKILSTHLGVPPERFDYRVDGKPTKNDGIKTTKTKVTTMTPLDFAKDVAGFDPDDYVSVASYPNKKDDTVYEIKKSAIGKTRPGEPTFDLRFLNVSPERMEQLAAASIKGGQAVWFAAEVRQDVDHKTGVMHPGVYDRASVYQFSKDEEAPALSRKENGYFQQVVADHAMLLTGYDQPDPDGPIVKFKVENSWGDKYGSEGIYHLYHDWFVKNVFEVVVNKKFLSESELALWKGKAKRTKRKD